MKKKNTPATPPTPTAETVSIEQINAMNTGTAAAMKEESLDEMFKKFETTVSEMEPEEITEGETGENTSPEKQIENSIKVKMFTGFMLFLLAGFNCFVLNFAKKTRVPMDKMFLTEPEKATIEPYMNTPEIIAWINKIPTWVIAVLHIEYMFMQKHALYSDEYKIIKPETGEDKK